MDILLISDCTMEELPACDESELLKGKYINRPNTWFMQFCNAFR
jgi:hypothetical protein